MARTYLAKEINSDLITKKISVRSWKEVRTKFFEVAVTHGASQNRLQAVVDEFISFYNCERKNKDDFTPYEIGSKTI